ncbi:SprT-like family-domain-containing protein [Lasiosphaeria miniovina]|uniref:SprT-like family-domain-containing protein n=1 Tax=Lasiosphaeria miniovina TaxID=1954250 RepID=A0AA40ACD1_9PEZI|nr:SprT-like family-domain-containing protein [Lasiosphaeria miniovina]KAK0713140.1 SprT-like family-domain-containing protein [Lasiosphaeria miniovina]
MELNSVFLVISIDMNLINTFLSDAFDEAGESEGARSRPKLTPPNTPPKPSRGLVSPKKMPRIPATPHQPSSDIFWSREFVDEWNDEHSPRKQLFPDATKRSPEKHSPEKKKASTKTATDRESKKAFEQAKHDTAEKFLGELDTVITGGKLSELAASTGGIKLKWTNKLNTTAGRANWKRETIRSSHKRGDPAAGGAAAGGATAPDGTTTVVQHNHYASIELAEKVIDDEHRLLNVMAHEFCHLANFMVSGITKNPHGKEFKAWAAKCSRAFGDRGIEVTTKHSYDIDFKYVWQCTACSLEFKRHSKSIDPGRHRCGSCKSELRQIKPAPRAASAKPSEYQAFMKVQMKLMKEENPKSPQKDIMKLVASKWAQKGGGAAAAASGRSVSPADSGNSSSGGFRDVSKDLENLVAIEDD